MAKITINDLYKMKENGEKIVMITAYDALFAKLFNDQVDMVLVGDSLNMSFGGHSKDLLFDRAVKYAWDKGTLCICSAGNYAMSPYLLTRGSSSAAERPPA